MIQGCSRDQLLHEHKKSPVRWIRSNGEMVSHHGFGAPSGTRTRDTLIKSQESRNRVRQ